MRRLAIYFYKSVLSVTSVDEKQIPISLDLLMSCAAESTVDMDNAAFDADFAFGEKLNRLGIDSSFGFKNTVI